MEETDPPNIPPTKMPIMNSMPWEASITYVIGSIMAMTIVGPTPGIEPMMMPMNTPRIEKNSGPRLKLVAKPCRIDEKTVFIMDYAFHPLLL